MTNNNLILIAPTAAKDRLTDKGCIFLDVRTDVEFSEERVPNSHNIPLDRLQESLGELDPSSHISLICLSGKRAGKAAEILSEKGFENLDIIEGGLTSWKSAGLPVETSSTKILPLMRQVQLAIGILTLTASLLAIFVNSLFAILPVFLGAGLTFAGATGWCGLAILLSKMPWNKTSSTVESCCAS